MYRFNKLENDSDADVRYIAEKIRIIYKGLDQVVNSKSTYLDSALKNENSEKDALIDIIGFCKNNVDEVWKKYDVNKERGIKH